MTTWSGWQDKARHSKLFSAASKVTILEPLTPSKSDSGNHLSSGSAVSSSQIKLIPNPVVFENTVNGSKEFCRMGLRFRD